MDTDEQIQLTSSAMILLIEDELTRAEGVQEMLVSLAYQCHSVSTIQQAIEFIDAKGAIDLLIVATQSDLSHHLDSIRERVDGYLSVIVIRDRFSDELLDDLEVVGIDCFITWPVNPRLLKTKVNSALRNRQLHQHEIEKRRQLLEYWRQTELEQDIAIRIYNNILQSNFLQTDVVKAVLSPKTVFNGDLLLVDKTPDDHLYVLLGDFVGHGLSASIAVAPVADIFYGMARKGFAIADIIREINSKLHKILPANIFLAATAAALYPDSKTLNLITCGLPEHVLISLVDGSFKTIHSKNIPLGIQASIDLVEQNYSVDTRHHLYLLTDGVFEAENNRGEAFGRERIIEAICQDDGLGIETLQARLAEHTQGACQKDDMSFVELICDVNHATWQTGRSEHGNKPVEALNWKSMMEFGIDALRIVNPVPVIVNALMEIQCLQQHRQAIFLIVSELFANALDHGLLELDSTIKSTPEGFMRFYQLRDERLQGLQQGKIRLMFVHKPTVRGGELTIKVMDSGPGFDWHQHRQALDNNSSFCGRGIKLVETLCTRLTFHGIGNRVTAVFDWQRDA